MVTPAWFSISFFDSVCKGVLKGHTEWVRCLASSSGSGLIASGAMDKVHFRMLMFLMKLCLMFFSGWFHKTVRLWDPSKEESVQVLNGHEHSVECVIFSSPEMDKVVIENLVSSKSKLSRDLQT